MFYDQLSAALSSAPPHDELFILGDANAVTRSDHTLFLFVVSDTAPERLSTTTRSTCCLFARRTVWVPSVPGSGGRLSRGGLGSQMMAELEKSWTTSSRTPGPWSDHQCRAEAPASTDHRLVVAVVSLAFVHHGKPKKPPKFDVLRLTTDVHVRAAYNDSLQARLPLAAVIC